MAVQNLGRVGLVLKGDWSSSTAYVPLDVVSYDGNSWVAKRNNTNVEPNTINTSDWQLISNNASLVATVQGYKNDAEAAASAAALSASAGEDAIANEANAFSATENYAAGDYVIYDNGTHKYLYRFTSAHSAGSWVGTDAVQVPLANDVSALGQQMTDIAPFFLESAVYEAGDLVRYNRRLYRADQSHSGAWDAYHFTAACLEEGIKATIGGNNAICLRGAEKIGDNRFVGERVGDALADHVGETISVSFDLKASVARSIRVYAYQSVGYSIEDSYYFTPSTTEYTRFSFVTKVKNYGEESGYTHNGMVGFYDETDANTIYVKNFKIELGSIATPWAMSAQDAFEQAIQSLDIASVSEVKAYLGID